MYRTCLFIVLSLFSLPFFQRAAAQEKTEILILGSDHLAQIYRKDNPNTDVLDPKRKPEISAFVNAVSRYKPDLVMVERLPDKQGELDSLYSLYQKGTLDLAAMASGRDEIYQVAFPIASRMGLSGVAAVNSAGGTSQSILDNGKGIEIYKQATADLRKVVGEKYSLLNSGALSFDDYLRFLNSPEAYNLIYHLRYIIPARVTDGKFTNPDKLVDTAFVDPRYIGAELISIFKNRDYKIYSNIIKEQKESGGRRLLLIIGVAHIGSLKAIFRDDPEYTVVDALDYLK